MLVSFFISHSETQIENTAWVEPAVVWLTGTGSGKSFVFKYLLKLVNLVHQKLKIPDCFPSWYLDVATFEKMGAVMDENDAWLLGIYDEMTTFLMNLICINQRVILILMMWQYFYNSIMATLGQGRLVTYICSYLLYFVWVD